MMMNPTTGILNPAPTPPRTRRALILCDMQNDALPSLFSSNTPLTSNDSKNNDRRRSSNPENKDTVIDPKARRQAFLHSVQACLRASIPIKSHCNNDDDDNVFDANHPLIIFLGLQFPSRYEGLHSEHCLYGSLRRLNEKVGDGAAHWFMKGYPGCEILGSLRELVDGAPHNGVSSRTDGGCLGDDGADDNAVTSNETGDYNDGNDSQHERPIDSDSKRIQEATKNKTYLTLWRDNLSPPSTLKHHLKQHNITDVTVIGAKATQAVQSTLQYLAENLPYIDVSVVREALADDSDDRLSVMMEYFLPLYARVATLEEYVEVTCGLEGYCERLKMEEMMTQKQQLDQQQQPQVVATKSNSKRTKKDVYYYADCQRGGHFSIYVHHLTHRRALTPAMKSTPFAANSPSATTTTTSWVSHPTQKWYQDIFRGKQYTCPLGKKIVDFCDEPAFSEMVMFLKGREYLDDKGKLLELDSALCGKNGEEEREFLPETYSVQGGEVPGGRMWESITNNSMENKDDERGPWFVKETNKNGGRAIQICQHASQCLELANDPMETYVIQRHIPNPSLLTDGKKWHFKLYNLLICEEERDVGGGDDGNAAVPVWTLRSHKEAWLCTSDKSWSANDITPEAQVTIKRTKRFREGVPIKELNTPQNDNDVTSTDCPFTRAYSSMFKQCTDVVATLVERAIQSNKLQLRPGKKKQFELFSSDFMFNADFTKAYLIEFNFSPVIYDPYANQELSTDGLKRYQRLFEMYGEEAEVNDHEMIRDAVSIVFFPEETEKMKGADGSFGGWKVVKSIPRFVS
ncbi:hypothetical protein ACHAXS_008665 [Conticribra weissflogii]